MNINQKFSEYEIKLTQKQINQFNLYMEFLKSENLKFNLTNITEDDEIIVKHFLDSVIVYKVFNGNEKICDVGAGAGFPSLPLKILFPNLKVTLFDSVQKKVNFLNELIIKLKLDNCVAIHIRAEDAAKNKEFRENYDIVVARAVAELRTLNEYCLPFVKQNGCLLAYKGSNYLEEINNSKKSLQILGGKIINILNFNIDGIERTVLKIEKIKKTDEKYPRDGNKPRIKPL